MGSRPDDAHPALQHIDELGQFVERGAPQEGAERRDPAVVGGRLADLVTILGDRHAAEFVDDDFLPVEAVAALPENHRAGRLEADGQRDAEHQRGNQRQDQAGQDQVAEPLEPAADAVMRRFANGHDRHAAHRVEPGLDQVGDKDVGREIDRCRGVAQFVEQFQDARLRGHRQRDVDQVDRVVADIVDQLVELAEHFLAVVVLDPGQGPVVEIAGQPDAEIG